MDRGSVRSRDASVPLGVEVAASENKKEASDRVNARYIPDRLASNILCAPLNRMDPPHI
jgi:hypothetical protein